MAGRVEGIGVSWGRVAYTGNEDGADYGHRVSKEGSSG